MGTVRSGVVAALLAAYSGAAWAQAGGDRPSEQDIFGGSAPAPSGPAAPATGTPAAPAAPDAPPPPGTQAPATTPPAAAAATEAAGTERDRSVLGDISGETKHLSDYQAPENPLQIGGQLYLRAQSSVAQGAYPDRWTLSTPSLVDAYFDARPNPRVRAFILGRMSYNAAAPPGGSAGLMGGSSTGGMGAFSGGSPTGFTTFSTTRGPTSILDQMWIRFDIAQRVFVTAGKQHVRWGTGRFWQPTDYLHPIKRNPLDVFDARPGTSMLKLHLPWEDRAWNFYAFGVFEDPNTSSSNLERIAGGARAEIVIAGAEIGLDALVKRDQKPRFGIDFSTGIWDFDVYADVGIRSGQDFQTVAEIPPADRLPQGTCQVDPNNPASPQIALDPLSSHYQLQTLSGVKTQAVGGINYSRKYNDNDVFTIGAEYFYNQPGISDARLYPGLLFNTSNTQMFNFFYIGRHYAALFASFPAPYSWNYTTFTLSTLGNISDKSFVSRLDYSVTLLTHLTLEAFVAVHYGNRSGEFRAGFDIPAQTVGTPVMTQAGETATMCTFIPGQSISPLLLNLGVALRMKM
jgi:hypothetical protein